VCACVYVFVGDGGKGSQRGQGFGAGFKAQGEAGVVWGVWGVWWCEGCEGCRDLGFGVEGIGIGFRPNNCL